MELYDLCIETTRPLSLVFFGVHPLSLPSWDAISVTQCPDSAVRTFVPAMAGGKDETRDKWQTRLYKGAHAYKVTFISQTHCLQQTTFVRNFLNMNLDWAVPQKYWLLLRNIQSLTLLPLSKYLNTGVWWEWCLQDGRGEGEWSFQGDVPVDMLLGIHQRLFFFTVKTRCHKSLAELC